MEGLPEQLDFRPIFNKERPPIDSKEINPKSVFGKRPPSPLTARPPQELLNRNRQLAAEYARADRQAAQRADVGEGASATAMHAQVEPPAPEISAEGVVPTSGEMPPVPPAEPQA